MKKLRGHGILDNGYMLLTRGVHFIAHLGLDGKKSGSQPRRTFASNTKRESVRLGGDPCSVGLVKQRRCLCLTLVDMPSAALLGSEFLPAAERSLKQEEDLSCVETDIASLGPD